MPRKCAPCKTFLRETFLRQSFHQSSLACPFEVEQHIVGDTLSKPSVESLQVIIAAQLGTTGAILQQLGQDVASHIRHRQ